MVTSTGCVVTKIGNSSGAMEECLRRFESAAAHSASTVGMDLAGSDRHGSAVLVDIDAATLPKWAMNLTSILGTSNGAMEEGLRRFESPVAHRASAVGIDLAGSDRHGWRIRAVIAADSDAATLPNWATNLISILGISNGAMERYVTVTGLKPALELTSHCQTTHT